MPKTKARPLVVVESPTKARTLKKLLDRRYDVMASMGHVKDLPRSQLGVDVDDGFQPKYVVIKGKGPVIKELKQAARKADHILMATDPDREGEAISWHLAEILRPVNPRIARIEFHEVTKEAVRRAIEHPRELRDSLVNAQQARRIVDRLVGYKLSPLLWRKVRSGLSAGRVQSVAVRLVVDREREIERFTPEEYWSLAAHLAKLDRDGTFQAKLAQHDGERVEIRTAEAAQAIVRALEGATYVVREVRRKDQARNPAPPFTTSTMQQEANRKLGYTAARTMALAQQLYEGIDIGKEGTVGLITYMRTDSVNVAESARSEAARYIEEAYGRPFLPDAPRRYASRRGAQEAHEAIRPTAVFRTPERMRPHLASPQYRLYKLIWERFVASQMASAVLDTLSVDVAAGAYLFRATGSRIKFAGFMQLYLEGRDNGEEEQAEGWLPELAEGERLRLVRLEPAQHFTAPPPRYTEATLVRALEEQGIGRPSTYAPIIETIKRRGYVHVEERRLVPTDVGTLVTDLLVEHFPGVVDVGFTAAMESELDRVEDGDAQWPEVVRQFYEPFAQVLSRAEDRIEEVDMTPVPIGEACPICGRDLVRKHGRYGEFIGCSGYPGCTYTRPIGIGVPCPLDGGEIVARRSKRGRVFYGCANYPSCTFVSWDRPVDQRCPRSGHIMVERRSRGRTVRRCWDKTCGYVEDARAREPVGHRAAR